MVKKILGSVEEIKTYVVKFFKCVRIFHGVDNICLEILVADKFE